MSAQNPSPTTGAEQEHPSPHRNSAPLLALWSGLLLAPTAYFIEMSVETPLLSQTCYPRDEPLQGELLATAHLVLAVDVVTLMLTLAGFFIAWRTWHRTAAEKPGGRERVLASGDGRSRFMAMGGMLGSAMMAIAVLYVLLNHLILRECGL